MKIFSIVGARPNFIKLDLDLRNQFIIHTGQHYSYEMSAIFFDELNIPDPLVNLNCKGSETGKMIDRLGGVLKKHRPDFVQVFGDTNSSLAGALAAAYQNIPVAHIESGLRSGNKAMPEEINRILIDHIAKIKFCPNDEAVLNLYKEGIRDGVHNVGDPSFDTFTQFLPIPKARNFGKYSVLTIHRNFNDEPKFISKVLAAIRESKEKFIFPMHPRLKITNAPKNISIIKPQPYKKMLQLISNAKRVVTDSGGVQREAFWMNVPVIILRRETEWPEIISKGGGILVSPEFLKESIASFTGKVNSPPEQGAKERIRNILFKYI